MPISTTVEGSLRVLAPYMEDGFKLLCLGARPSALEQTSIDRVRGQISVSLSQELSDPNSIASKAWFKDALGSHPYARPVYGTLDTIKKITRDDIVKYHAHAIGRGRIKVAVVRAGRCKDTRAASRRTFGTLPNLPAPEQPKPISFVAQNKIDVNSARHSAKHRRVRCARHHAAGQDFLAAYVMNYILGGGGFSSRLMDEIREKRGLTYGISTSLSAYEGGGLFVGGFSTRNDSAGDAYRILISEVERMAKDGATDQEIADAKTNLTGSYALRCDSNEHISNQLLTYRVLGYPIDYIFKRNDLIRR